MSGSRLRWAAGFVAACLVVGAVAALGGVLFQVIHGGTTITRSVAYAFWFAAAFALLLMVPAGSKQVWRSSRLPALESWWFVTAATVLTAVGALIDAFGTS